jgi:hypothetical protein
MTIYHPPIDPPNSGTEGSEAAFWTFEAVLERLIETVCAWRRMPGGGHWPFASDGPWHLIRKEWEDWDARDPKALRPLPLRRAEIGAMYEATEWITWVEEEKRVALVFGLAKLAGGHRQVPWRTLHRRLGTVGTGGLQWRFDQAVQFIANVLNALSGEAYVSRKGARARWPQPVLDVVGRVEQARRSA